MSERIYYAHSLPDKPQACWQRLDEHLKHVAFLASEFAKGFRGSDWAYLAGLWHDLGKYTEKFQKRIHNGNETSSQDNPVQSRVDHSTAGARHAVQRWPDAGKLMAYLIAGHHGGLPDGINSNRTDLRGRLDSKRLIPAIDKYACTDFLDVGTKPGLPFKQDIGRIGFQLAFFIRMLFSCLVDADFLDTERFIDPEKSMLRQKRSTLVELEILLNKTLRQFKPDSAINEKRATVLQNCVHAAEKPPGLYTLTVPTGGGKTLSSLAFALRHALTHHKKRCIYVIPFTSIIEQNAAVFRSILGDEAILEHHSNYAPEYISDGDDQETSMNARRHRLVCENWDAPLIVTTNVQFFNSLFANRSSKCRKLHNIVGSVIILDEAQMLPESYLRPCLEAIRELSDNYGCTIVLCTATQPALRQSSSFPFGLPVQKVTEIITDPKKLHTEFNRVRLSNIGAISDEYLAVRLEQNEKVLCIVNTRQRAADIFGKIKDLPGAYHLSARMCPAHRSMELKKIHKDLEDGRACRLISTQIVEAGVDIDFPVVYREMAGMDAIAQAAGRCNRHAKLHRGEVFVFLPEDKCLPRLFRRAAAAAESVLDRFDDPFSPDALYDYFSQVYWIAGDELDKKQLLKQHEGGVAKGDLPLRQIAEQFRLIESDMVPVIVPWDEKARNLINKLAFVTSPIGILRQLQMFTIQIYSKEFEQLLKNGAIEMISGRYAVLNSLVPYYCENYGLNIDIADLSPELFFC